MLSIMATVVFEPGLSYGQLVDDAEIQDAWRTHRNWQGPPLGCK